MAKILDVETVHYPFKYKVVKGKYVTGRSGAPKAFPSNKTMCGLNYRGRVNLEVSTDKRDVNCGNCLKTLAT